MERRTLLRALIPTAGSDSINPPSPPFSKGGNSPAGDFTVVQAKEWFQNQGGRKRQEKMKRRKECCLVLAFRYHRSLKLQRSRLGLKSEAAKIEALANGGRRLHLRHHHV